MKIAGESGAFGQSFIKAGIQPPGDLAHAQAKSHPNSQKRNADAQHAEPRRLVPRRRDDEIQTCAFFVPDTVIVAGDYVEAVLPRAQIGIERLAARSRILPAGIAPFELVAK